MIIQKRRSVQLSPEAKAAAQAAEAEKKAYSRPERLADLLLKVQKQKSSKVSGRDYYEMKKHKRVNTRLAEAKRFFISKPKTKNENHYLETSDSESLYY